jgi:hypothetical protein
MSESEILDKLDALRAERKKILSTHGGDFKDLTYTDRIRYLKLLEAESVLIEQLTLVLKEQG